MVIPYRVDVPFNHRPVMNWLLVTSVIFVFFVQLSAIADPVASKRIYSFVLDGWGIRGLFGHMWLHAGRFISSSICRIRSDCSSESSDIGRWKCDWRQRSH